jgi:hypothetical protein
LAVRRYDFENRRIGGVPIRIEGRIGPRQNASDEVHGAFDDDIEIKLRLGRSGKDRVTRAASQDMPKDTPVEILISDEPGTARHNDVRATDKKRSRIQMAGSSARLRQMSDSSSEPIAIPERRRTSYCVRTQ